MLWLEKEFFGLFVRVTNVVGLTLMRVNMSKIDVLKENVCGGS